jgi:hypothetical protein
MARCFITGVELKLEESYVLDITVAHRALRELRQQAASLERIIQQLGQRDDTEIFDRKKGEPAIRKDRRLVSPSVAEALSAAYPQKKLFIQWTEWRSRRSNVSNVLAGKSGESDEAHS